MRSIEATIFLAKNRTIIAIMRFAVKAWNLALAGGLGRYVTSQ